MPAVPLNGGFNAQEFESSRMVDERTFIACFQSQTILEAT